MRYIYRIEKATVPNRHYHMPDVEICVGGSFVPADGKTEIAVTPASVVRRNKSGGDACMDYIAGWFGGAGQRSRSADFACEVTDDLAENSKIYWTAGPGGKPSMFIIAWADAMRAADVTGCVYLIQDGQVMRECMPDEGDAIFDERNECE